MSTTTVTWQEIKDLIEAYGNAEWNAGYLWAGDDFSEVEEEEIVTKQVETRTAIVDAFIKLGVLPKD